MRILWDLLAFQAGWFACVLGGANQLPWLGVLAVLVLVAMHELLALSPGKEIKLVIIAAAIGFVWDSLLVSMGWLVYPSGTLWAGTAPVWMVAMWANLAMSLNLSLAWLKGRLILAAFFGAIGGPLAYLGGAKLGGVVLAQPAAALIVLAIGWSFLMPVLTVLAIRYNGFEADFKIHDMAFQRV